LFTLQHGSDFTALLVYVDDIILAGTSLIDLWARIHEYDQRMADETSLKFLPRRRSKIVKSKSLACPIKPGQRVVFHLPNDFVIGEYGSWDSKFYLVRNSSG
jgi:hypothetical protein